MPARAYRRPNFEGRGIDAGRRLRTYVLLEPNAGSERRVSDEKHFDTVQPTTLLAGYVPRCSAEPGLNGSDCHKAVTVTPPPVRLAFLARKSAAPVSCHGRWRAQAGQAHRKEKIGRGLI
jgi:hypothetical protein